MELSTKPLNDDKTAVARRKVKVGWFSFSCCEDSTIIFTELMNEHWQEWKHIIDFRHARVLKTNNILDELDVAFVEGALTSQEQIDKVREIREKSNIFVAIGACACLGMPSAQRNRFDEELQEEIEPLLARFAHLEKVLKLSDVIKVDAKVPGCPMNPDTFMKIFDGILKQLKFI